MDTGQWAGPPWQQQTWSPGTLAPFPPAPPRPPFRWVPVLVAGVVGVAIGLLLAVLLFAVLGMAGVLDPDPLTRGPDGALPRFDLAEGQCANGVVAPGTSFGRDAAVPCPEPHELEVYASLASPGARAERYPHPADLAYYAESACLLAFEGFIGDDYDASDLDYVGVVPSRTTWQRGDRDLRCVLMRIDGEVLTGSARTTG